MSAAIPVSASRKPGIGLTPLIDIVFILLVFFMLVVQFQKLQQRELVTHESGAAVVESSDQLPVVMSLLAATSDDTTSLCQLRVGQATRTADCETLVAELSSVPEVDRALASGNGLVMAFHDEAVLTAILTLRSALEGRYPQVQLVLESPDAAPMPTTSDQVASDD